MTLSFPMCLLFCSELHSQTESQFNQSQLNQPISEANRFERLSLFAEASEFYQEALSLADSINEEELKLEVEIQFIELLRKSHQIELAYDRLISLQNVSAYPEIYVRFLSLKSEIILNLVDQFTANQIKDSTSLLLNKAVEIAQENNLKSLEANLKNQLGFKISREVDRDEGDRILMEAASIFLYENDTQNYVVTSIHILENAIETGNFDKANELKDQLLELVKDRDWWTIEIDLFNQVSHYFKATNDAYNAIFWEHEAAKSFEKYNNAINNGKMAAFRAMYENQKFKELSERQKAALEEQQKRNFLLFIEILGLILFMLVLVVLWIRETRLRAVLRQSHDALEEANARYQMLLVESNHRIKNNLQMVVSMLNFSRRDSEEHESEAIKRVTKSVYTIASLHKHLYPDIQSESVSLRSYFDEILKIYDEITYQDIELEIDLEDLWIKSDRIVYFGLVLSELISNTLEHCSKKGQEIKISLRVKPEGDRYCFYHSDGSAWAETDISGTGMTLIEIIVKTLGGVQFIIDKQKGSYKFFFAI